MSKPLSRTVVTLWNTLLCCAILVACGATSQEDVSAPTRSPEPSVAANTENWRVVGTSVEGRPIRALTLGHGTRKVLFVGGIHGDEPEGAYATSQLPAAFLSSGLSDKVSLTIVEDANPDGRAARTRDNANGVDVNRNFPAVNFDGSDPAHGGVPLSQPESRALHDLIEKVDPELVVVMHSWTDRQFINFDGPARDLAVRFAAKSELPIADSQSFAPTPGSLGSYVGRDRGTPLLTIELLKGSDPKDDWRRIRAALLQAIGA